ncbi:hypothetical protein, partial [uncultured Meiothermus sp.]|uniref:carboxymuconolactone decarboxylase family protein n=1 Tax=uncultured Meiothermus sp. TaxID=157471 RepID=UPI00262A1EA6
TAPLEVAQIYAEIKQTLQIPFIPNGIKVAATSPLVLKAYWALYRDFSQQTSLPQSLVAMILYTIAERNHCQYCSATNELTCRTLGVDEETLRALVDDLEHVSPERLQAIIEFAVKAARDPKNLSAEDFDRVRRHGLSDAELVEIVFLAAIGNFNDTLADALKFPVESAVAQALGWR